MLFTFENTERLVGFELWLSHRSTRNLEVEQLARETVPLGVAIFFVFLLLVLLRFFIEHSDATEG